MKKRKYRWYLEPLDSRTNSIIAGELPEENAHRALICQDGVPRNLWECPEDFFHVVARSAKSINLKFKIFCQEGNGKIRECSFLYRKKRKKL